MKNTKTKDLATAVDATYAKLLSARSQTKRTRTMFLNAKTSEAEAETEFKKAKDVLEQSITETN